MQSTIKRAAELKGTENPSQVTGAARYETPGQLLAYGVISKATPEL